MGFNSCEFSALSSAEYTDGGKRFKMAFCLAEKCIYPAKYCAPKHQTEYVNDRVDIIMKEKNWR